MKLNAWKSIWYLVQCIYFISQVLAEKGNTIVNEEYEKYIPPYYRKPHQHDVE